jgi:hypothetical protein
MTDTLAIEAVFDAVTARFTAEGTNAVNVFGWRQPAQHPLSNRIAWVPGDDKSGAAGTAAPARNPGRNPRPIGTFLEVFTVYIYAYDTTDLENERLQYKATRLLRDAWERAVYLAAHGTFAILSQGWVPDKLERRFGATMRVLFQVEAMVPDEPALLAPVDTKAVIDMSVGLQTDVVTNDGDPLTNDGEPLFSSEFEQIQAP